MSDTSEKPHPGQRVLVLIGGSALFLATVVETIAVVGRYIGVPLLGAIEIIQASVLVAGSVALVLSTIERRHAVVRLVFDRTGAGVRKGLSRINNFAAGLLALCFLAGSSWIAMDLWDAHEESDLLMIPYAPLRLFSCAALAIVSIAFFTESIKGDS